MNYKTIAVVFLLSLALVIPVFATDAQNSISNKIDVLSVVFKLEDARMQIIGNQTAAAALVNYYTNIEKNDANRAKYQDIYDKLGSVISDIDAIKAKIGNNVNNFAAVKDEVRQDINNMASKLTGEEPRFVSGPYVTYVNDITVAISWTNNMPTTAGVYCLAPKESCFASINEYTSSAQHTVWISGLKPTTNYVYIVNATTTDGNYVRSTNGFTTLASGTRNLGDNIIFSNAIYNSLGWFGREGIMTVDITNTGNDDIDLQNYNLWIVKKDQSSPTGFKFDYELQYLTYGPLKAGQTMRYYDTSTKFSDENCKEGFSIGLAERENTAVIPPTKVIFTKNVALKCISDTSDQSLSGFNMEVGDSKNINVNGGSHKITLLDVDVPGESATIDIDGYQQNMKIGETKTFQDIINVKLYATFGIVYGKTKESAIIIISP
ncbi:MAG: hypothetical protein NT120_03980, partial [Candidatus Aenigmarchaeota archaeon]|nr:hypothetical protein [Candidatus Aenigmarchaeota archaeon]